MGNINSRFQPAQTERHPWLAAFLSELAGVLNLFFNPLKLRETINIGVYGIFQIQDSSQLSKTLQTARQRGGFSSSQTVPCSKTCRQLDQPGSLDLGSRTSPPNTKHPGMN